MKVPGTEVCLLTQTSKMPGPSFSLPAHRSCPRANGSICDSCYASKGMYGFKNVQNAQDVRFKWTVDSMRDELKRKAWTRLMISAIEGTGCDYFRLHDSGDMFNASYAHAWYEVCSSMPRVKFWIPTRAWQSPHSALPVFDPVMNALRQLASLPNVTVRPSALNFGDWAPSVEGLHAGSTAGMADVMRARECPAWKQGGECRDCRTCWDSKDTPVSYHKH